MEKKEIIVGISEKTISDFKEMWGVRLSKQLCNNDIETVMESIKRDAKNRVFDKELLTDIINTEWYAGKYRIYIALYGDMSYTTSLYCIVNNDRTVTMSTPDDLELTPEFSNWAIPVVIVDMGRTKKYIECWKWEENS